MTTLNFNLGVEFLLSSLTDTCIANSLGVQDRTGPIPTCIADWVGVQDRAGSRNPDQDANSPRPVLWRPPLGSWGPYSPRPGHRLPRLVPQHPGRDPGHSTRPREYSKLIWPNLVEHMSETGVQHFSTTGPQLNREVWSCIVMFRLPERAIITTHSSLSWWYDIQEH